MLGTVATALGAASTTLKSPDGKVVCRIAVEDSALAYQVSYNGQALVEPSGISFVHENKTPIGKHLAEVKIGEATEQRGSWEPVYGERSTIQDNYNTVSVTCRDTKADCDVAYEFRCYDTGVAFRTTIGAGDGKPVKLREERSEFRFAGDPSAWRTNRAQGAYDLVSISQLGNDVERPLTIQAKDGVYVSIAEAGLLDYAVMKLKVDPARPDTVVSELRSAVESKGDLTTPWRVIFVAESPGELLESNDLILNLSEPCRIADTSWIKPGKVIRDYTLTNAGAKACVDFAVKHNIQYVEFDAGWYGNEFEEVSDATTISVDPKRSPGPLDLHDIIKYAEERGIGILVYVNRRALEKQLDDILPLYQGWGIKGIKFGFVKHGSQKWTRWLHESIAKAADHGLLAYVHDDYRPVGYSRTYPNLMTQEGVRGDEETPPTKQTLTSLFTRSVAGAADNTFCYFNPRVDEAWSHAHQLAKSVCIFSPLQTLFWYDGPDRGDGGKFQIVEVPEMAFWDAMPAVWDDTRVLHGEIGRYAVVARRSGEEWFIGGLSSEESRTLKTPLDFLEPGREYVAHIYSDDPTVKTVTKVAVTQQTVDSTTVFPVTMRGNGGQAIHLVPKGE